MNQESNNMTNKIWNDNANIKKSRQATFWWHWVRFEPDRE